MINPFKTSREEKHVPNIVRASVRTKPITVSQPPVITKKVVNFDSNGLSSTGVDNTKTKRPQPRSNTKNDRVPSASKSSCNKNKEIEVEEHHRKLLLSRNKKHMSSECNNVKLATQNVKVVCAMCKQCLNYVNHDVCLLNYVNRMNFRGKKQKANVSINKHQKKQQSKVKKTKNVGSIERLATPKPSNLNMFMFLGTIRFGNDHVAAILGFGDLQWGNILITRVYFIEGLGHNLFSVGQFCDSDLEVAFRRNECFVRNLEGVDLLKGNRTTNLYTINLHDMASASPICLMACATSTKSWLWHQRLSHLNFNTINDLAKNDLVSGLPKFKSKDEAPEVIKTFLKRISILLQSPVIIIRTDNDTEFKNQVFKEFFDSVGISHQVSSIRIPQQNGVVEQRNRTLVEATRIMLIFSRAPLFLWPEAIATACFTQNCSIIHRRFNKTSYELINSRKLDISFLHEFGALCYPKNDREDIGKLGSKGDIGFFIRYSADSYAFRVSKPRLQSMTSGQISSGLDLTYAPSTITTQQPTEGKLDLLFEAMYDDYIGGQTSAAQRNYQAKPTKKHLKEVKRIFLYLWGTVNTGLWYTKDFGFELTGFSDADYAGCKDTFKKFLRKKLVSWSSKKQDCTALSTAEAEHVYLSTCCAQVLWMRTQLTDYGFHFKKIPIYCDSKLAIAISCNSVQHSRTKHIAVHYHFIKEHVEKGTIELYFVKTDYQRADLFTKALLVY
nr:copia protein [Tanacetum cinerariifolium]